MSTRNFMQIAVLISMIVLFTLNVQAFDNPKADQSSSTQDPGLLAAEIASAAGQFLMVLFQKTSNSTPLTHSFDTVRKSLPDSVKSIVITTEKPEEKGLADRYNVHWAPLPMVVVLAPNGAITGTFQTPFTEKQLKETLVSPASQKCLIAFQQQKLVFVCIQGKTTANNTEAIDGVTQFQKNHKFGQMTEIVIIDPDDPEEKTLLNQLRINPKPAIAETLLIAPPGKVIGKWTGPTSKEAIVQLLVAQASAPKTCKIPGCGDPKCETPQKPLAEGGVN